MVDLPAPFGPIRPTISPARHVEADVVDGDQPAEALDRAVDRSSACRAAGSVRRGSGATGGERGVGGGALSGRAPPARDEAHQRRRARAAAAG